MLSYLVGTVTQGSSDAYAQGTITTGLQNTSGQAFRIRQIEFSLPVLIGADSFLQCGLTRKSLAAVPALTDHSIIKSFNRYCELTTSGMVIQDQIVTWTYSKDEDLVIVEDPLYFYVDTNGTSLSNTFAVRIAYESRKISEVERLAIVAASLA